MRHPPSPSVAHELVLQNAGYRSVAGIDEAGRGAWAGPVVAAAVILPLTTVHISTLIGLGVNDSKLLSVRQRTACREAIERCALCFALGAASHIEIDELGIVCATRLAMMRAVKHLSSTPDALVIDAVKLPDLDLPQDVFFHADSISVSVAAASILAKTERDTLMCALDELLPAYGFAKHKGYGTRRHQMALTLRGVSWAHRRSYTPIKRLLMGIS